MDYTNQTKNERGIEWNKIAPTDIAPFTVFNSENVDITFCAFEENTIKIEGEKKEKSHCEGLLFPTTNNDKTWIVLLELKYPQKRDNLGSNLKGAREQLLLTLHLFREQSIIEEKRLVHLIFSAPKYTHKTPFESWSLEPFELKKIRKYNYAILRGVNGIKVLSEKKLKV